ncbi:Predicted arabinose efflux permease, MFS family [Fulvimarina manganoxydans]|uniref:Predicted arabinose efflux permease, MFS family n=1 Tax=Fulvimarina manganoxydans TaxID=937218 RepID=A0A1W2CJ73_9HYPH|nr:MFS transporter [Fulvimarina manganoxydans]SMC85076.1 Predicted arabinose efflux permease, MFS family [Fulvimarina manganoxydans]
MTAPTRPHSETDVATVLAIVCGCLIALLTFGPRSAIGFFQIPMLADRGWSREDFALAIAVQNLLWGAGQPIFGAIADRYGTARVLLLSGLLYASGLALTAVATDPLLLILGQGVLVGLGIAAGSFGIVLAAFARRVSAERRSFVFGLGTAAGSAGMFVFAPFSQALIASYGWVDALFVMAATMLFVPLLAIALKGAPRTGALTTAVVEQSMGEALREAFATRSYMLLTAGFFVCGFQVAFITAHFPAYLADKGIAPVWAVTAMALIGFFNIIGSIASGLIGQRYSKPIFLALIYIGRSIAVTVFLLVAMTPASVVVFSLVMGVLWLSTVPPTNALVAIMFGTKYLGLLGGLVFLSHQVGSFLGVWLGGVLRATTGSYDGVWWLGVALGLVAALVHWPIREAPAARLVPAE